MNESNVRQWVRAYLARTTNVEPAQIRFDRTLADFGLDSVDAVLMAGEMEDATGMQVDPASFIQYDTFEEMVAALEQRAE